MFQCHSVLIIVTQDKSAFGGRKDTALALRLSSKPCPPSLLSQSIYTNFNKRNGHLPEWSSPDDPAKFLAAVGRLKPSLYNANGHEGILVTMLWDAFSMNLRT